MQKAAKRIKDLEDKVAEKDEACLTLVQDRETADKQIEALRQENRELKVQMSEQESTKAVRELEDKLAQREQDLKDLTVTKGAFCKQIQGLEEALKNARQNSKQMEEDKKKQSSEFQQQLDLIEKSRRNTDQENQKLTEKIKRRELSAVQRSAHTSLTRELED